MLPIRLFAQLPWRWSRGAGSLLTRRVLSAKSYCPCLTAKAHRNCSEESETRCYLIPRTAQPQCAASEAVCVLRSGLYDVGLLPGGVVRGRQPAVLQRGDHLRRHMAVCDPVNPVRGGRPSIKLVRDLICMRIGDCGDVAKSLKQRRRPNCLRRSSAGHDPQDKSGGR